jgi:hypothetical protein
MTTSAFHVTVRTPSTLVNIGVDAPKALLTDAAAAPEKAARFVSYTFSEDCNDDIKNSSTKWCESETEDEEVKLSCMGGVRGSHDSDMNTTDDDFSVDDEEGADDRMPDR